MTTKKVVFEISVMFAPDADDVDYDAMLNVLIEAADSAGLDVDGQYREVDTWRARSRC